MIECSSRSDNAIGRELSNLAPHAFEFQGRQFGSMEGFLQSLKFQGEVFKDEIGKLSGVKAWKAGQQGNSWKELQYLYDNNGNMVDRLSDKYQVLIKEAYDALWNCSKYFRLALRDSGREQLWHNGKHDSQDTVLTVCEYIFNLYRLRA